MASIFSKIISGEIPAHKIAETQNYLAFLDINPLMTGHTLVVPKSEMDVIYDMDDELFIGLHLFAKAIAKSLHKAIECKRIGFAIIGLEVPHAHIHLIPINSVSDMDFSKSRPKPTDEELANIAEKIRSFI